MILHRIPDRIRHGHDALRRFGHQADAGRVQGGCARMRVGAHQPARPQQDAAEVPGDHDAAVDDAPPADDLHHRQARRARRLPVVAVADDAGVPADHIRVAVVGRVAVARPLVLQEGQRLLLRFAGRGVAQEAALLHHVFVLRGPEQRQVAFAGHAFAKVSSSIAMPRSMSWGAAMEKFSRKVFRCPPSG